MMANLAAMQPEIVTLVELFIVFMEELILWLCVDTVSRLIVIKMETKPQRKSPE